MKRLIKREKVLLVILAIVATGAAYYNFFLSGLLDQYNSVSSDIENLTLDLSTARLYFDALPDTKDKHATVSKEADEMTSSIPERLNHPEVLVALSDTLSPFVRNLEIVFSDAKLNLETGTIVYVEISGMCSPENVSHIIESAENLRWPAKVQTFTQRSTITSGGENGLYASDAAITFSLAFMILGGN